MASIKNGQFYGERLYKLFFLRDKTVKSSAGFTLIELVMIILLLGILTGTAYVKWPSGLDDTAALLELKRAIRHTQHLAMTRGYDADNIWRLHIESDHYTITNDGLIAVSSEFDNRYLLGNSDITLNGTSQVIYFNGLGEPVIANGTVATSSPTFTINGNLTLTVCPQTGFVVEGSNCL